MKLHCEIKNIFVVIFIISVKKRTFRKFCCANANCSVVFNELFSDKIKRRITVRDGLENVYIFNFVLEGKPFILKCRLMEEIMIDVSI